MTQQAVRALCGCAILTWFLSAPARAEYRLVFMQEMDGQKQVFLADGQGRNLRPMTKGSRWHLYPAIDTKGTRVAYVEGTDERHLGLVLQVLASGKREAWTPKDGRYLHPDFSGDGRHLAFSGPLGPDGRAQIGIFDLSKQKAVPLDGSTTENFPRPRTVVSEHPSFFPSLSSDGRFVVFHRSKASGHKDIVRVDLDSNETAVLTESENASMAPSLSFDDQWIAYVSKAGDNWDVHLMDRQGQKRKRVTTHAANDFAPAFQPDGRLVFASDRSGSFQLYEIDPASPESETNPPKPLPVVKGSAYAPSLSGDVRYRQDFHPAFPSPPRSSFGAARHGGRVFIVAGHRGPAHTYPPESFMSRVDYFDLHSQTWHRAAPRSVASHGFDVAAYGKHLYAFGGFAHSKKHDPKWKSLDVIERYDVEADQWETIGRMPRRRSSNVVAQIGSKAYLIGGWDSTPRFEGDKTGRFHSEIDVFDMATETMTTLDVSLPSPLRRALSAVVVGDEIVLLGGITAGQRRFQLIDKVTAFHPASQSWRELPPLPFATFAPSAGQIDGRIFIFGGLIRLGSEGFRYVNHIFALDPGAPAWRHAARYLAETKGFAQVVNLSPRLLGLLGGHTNGDNNAPVSTFELFELGAD